MGIMKIFEIIAWLYFYMKLLYQTDGFDYWVKKVANYQKKKKNKIPRIMLPNTWAFIGPKIFSTRSHKFGGGFFIFGKITYQSPKQ